MLLKGCENNSNSARFWGKRNDFRNELGGEIRFQSYNILNCLGVPWGKILSIIIAIIFRMVNVKDVMLTKPNTC